MAFQVETVPRTAAKVRRSATFLNNVRDTNNLSKVSMRTNLIALTITVLGSMSVGRGSDPVLGYFFFITAAMGLFLFHPKARELIDYAAFKLKYASRPILQSAAVGVPLMAFVVLVLAAPVRAGSASDKAFDIFLFAIVGGFVEEVIRWVWLQTLPFSIIFANGLWVFLHPSVAVLFAGQAPNWAFAVFAFLFGLLMTAVMAMYELPVPGQLGFGPVAAASFHAIFNAIVLSFALTVSGVQFDRLSWFGGVS